MMTLIYLQLNLLSYENICNIIDQFYASFN